MTETDKSIMITLSDAEILGHPFLNVNGEVSFYRYIAEKCGFSWDDVTIDCRLIDVSPDIQDTWYAYARENGISQMSLTMTLAMSGPKALPEIPSKTVRVLEGCFSTNRKGENT